VEDEPDNDQQGEEDVERHRNRGVWNTEVEGDSGPEAATPVDLRGKQ